MKKNSKKETLILENGKYDIEKIYDLHKNQDYTISAIEFKYGIHRNELLTLLSEYDEKYKPESYYKEVQRGDLIQAKYIYEYNTYSVIGEVVKKNLNSVMVICTDGDCLPDELLNMVIVSNNNLKILKKNP